MVAFGVSLDGVADGCSGLHDRVFRHRYADEQDGTQVFEYRAS